jgi:CarD family transcriptional regulator
MKASGGSATSTRARGVAATAAPSHAAAPKRTAAKPQAMTEVKKVAPAKPEDRTEPADVALATSDTVSHPTAAARPAGPPAQPMGAVAPGGVSLPGIPSGPSIPPGPRRTGPTDRMPPPRAMAKAEIFVEGDHVVYPTHGVGKVERIAIEEIAGHKLELIHITFEENRMTLRVPVAKARTAGLRKLATRKLFDEAMAVLKGRARIKRTMWSRRAQEYEAKINSGDPLAIAEVVRDLHRNAGQPDQSFSERQIYEAAMDRLAAELAALDKTDKTTAAAKLVHFLKTV